ncbi:MAG TPA: hypothetical protein VIP11_22080 [Gemmatimonadaceae bacterium]
MHALRKCDQEIAFDVSSRRAAPWKAPRSRPWEWLHKTVGDYAASCRERGESPEQVIVHLTEMLNELPVHPDRKPRLRAALIAFVLEAYFSGEPATP